MNEIISECKDDLERNIAWLNQNDFTQNSWLKDSLTSMLQTYEDFLALTKQKNHFI